MCLCSWCVPVVRVVLPATPVRPAAPAAGGRGKAVGAPLAPPPPLRSHGTFPRVSPRDGSQGRGSPGTRSRKGGRVAAAPHRAGQRRARLLQWGKRRGGGHRRQPLARCALGQRRVRASGSPAPPASDPLPRAPALATRHASPTGGARHPAGHQRHRRWRNGERAGSPLGRGFTCFGSQCLAGSGVPTGTRGRDHPAPCSPPGPPACPNAPQYFGGQKSERALRKGRTAEGMRQPLRRGQAASPPPGDGVRCGWLRLRRRVYREHTQNKTKTAPGAS